MSIPARFREQIKAEHETPLVLTVGFDQCLFLYTMDEWKKVESQMASWNTLDPVVRQFVRLVLKATDEVEMDPQGRVMVSPVLRKEAGLSKGLVIVGMMHRIEIWDKQKYESYQTQASAQSLEVLGQRLSEKGIQSLNL
jgi:MraZ protein